MTKWFWHCLHVKKGSSGSFGTLVLYAKSKVPRRVPKKSLIYQGFWAFFCILVLWYSIFYKVVYKKIKNNKKNWIYRERSLKIRVPKYQTCFCAFKPCKIKGFGLWYSGTLVLCLEYQNDFCYSVTLRKSKVTSKVTSWNAVK